MFNALGLGVENLDRESVKCSLPNSSYKRMNFVNLKPCVDTLHTITSQGEKNRRLRLETKRQTANEICELEKNTHPATNVLKHLSQSIWKSLKKFSDAGYAGLRRKIFELLNN